MKKLKLEQCNRISLETYKQSEKIPVVVLLENIRSMNNVGSFFRTSDAFRIKKLFLCGISSIPPHRGIQKTALGATESVNWEYHTSTIQLIKNLKNENYAIIGIEQVIDSKFISSYSISTQKKYALIFGNEIEGISNGVLSLVEEFIEIPQSGTKHSLNVSVCAGIILWEFYKILNKKIISND